MKRLHLLLSLLFLAIASAAIAQQSDTPSATAEASEQIFHVVEQMPYFPGCEGEAYAKEHRRCSQEKMMEYIYEQLQYPQEARDHNIGGTVVIRFIVGKDGKLLDATIVREVGGGCGAEALRIVKNMPNWIPGKRRGQVVPVYFNLPVKFSSIKEEPIFAGCENETDRNKRRVCTKQKINAFIKANLQYPEDAKAKGIDGVVQIDFTIGKDGQVADAKIVKNVGGGCDQEALRLVKSLPAWTPGKQFYEQVEMPFSVSVPFKLKKRNPYFPGCAEETFDYKHQKCSRSIMEEFITANLQYPEAAKAQGIDGYVRIDCIIKKDGTISEAMIGKDIGGGCGAEALRIVNSMPAWVPGTKDGVPADIKHPILIQFKLKTLTAAFPGCEEIAPDKYQCRICNRKKMKEFVASNLQYPAEAKAKGIEGIVKIKFSIGKDGKIYDAKIHKDLGGGCGAEALRLVNSMPAWQPEQKGEVQMDTPGGLSVEFKLNTAIKEKATNK